MSKVVYVHRRDVDNSIFYVGMGNTDRPHSKDKRSNEWLSGKRTNKTNLKYV